MNTLIKKQKAIIATMLFVAFNYVNAQDTIHCFDERYHWTYPCNYSDYPDTIFEFSSSTLDLFQAGTIGTYLTTGEHFPVSPTNKVLTRQMFTDTVRRQIFGIAGTTIECHNPNGCYFYLYKKIG